jgi:hypothetical protein
LPAIAAIINDENSIKDVILNLVEISAGTNQIRK